MTRPESSPHKARPPCGYLHVELHVPEFESVKRFYGELGFSIAWQSDAPGEGGYLVMEKNAVVICFWPGNESINAQPYFKDFPEGTRRGFGVELVIMVDDLDDTYLRAQQLGAVVEELKMKPWGLRDFRAADPFGYYLRFNEAHDVLNPEYSVKDE